MAEYISFQPSANFSTKLYTGNSSTNAITGVGFQPDITWLKNLTGAASHSLQDSIRGNDKSLKTNSAIAEFTNSYFDSFDSDGFTLSTSETDVNVSGDDFVSWNWKAGTTSGITTDGNTNITPSAYSFNQTTGIAILKYTGNGSSDQQVAHGLGITPQQIIIKQLSTGESWASYNVGVSGINGPQDYSKELDTQDGKDGNSAYWQDTKPDSVNFTIGNGDRVNANAQEYIAYVFSPITGFSKFGNYRGNNNAEGNFAYCGFRPAFVLLKSDGGSTDWGLFDTKRPGNEWGNPYNRQLYANDTGVPATGEGMDINSNGFKIRATDAYVNGSGQVISFMAFAEFPIVSSNDVPGTAR